MSDLSPALLRFADVSVRLSVELGRTDMPLRDVLSLGQGSVVTLNRLTDELLDITANGKVVAQGEVIAQGGKFALRIVNLVGEAPGAATGLSPAAIGNGFPEASRAAAAPPPPPPPSMSTPTPMAESEPQPTAPAEPQPQTQEPVASPAPPPEPATPSETDEKKIEEAEPSPQSDGLDDLLDSTLDELTDALDDITPAEGDDDEDAG